MAHSSRDVLTRLTDRVPEAAVALLEQRSAEVASPQPAATVVLLRDDHDQGLQTYVLHRHSRMPFAPGMVVFPGGRIDPIDGVRAADRGLADPALLAGAIRETAEETGVRLTAAELVPWAHWITPELEPRRYDTAFYLAALPTGQTAADISGETTKAEWRTPAELLAEADAGVLQLMPPTRSVLLELTGYDRVADALRAAADRIVESVMPRPVRREDGWYWTWEIG